MEASSIGIDAGDLLSDTYQVLNARCPQVSSDDHEVTCSRCSNDRLLARIGRTAGFFGELRASTRLRHSLTYHHQTNAVLCRFAEWCTSPRCPTNIYLFQDPRVGSPNMPVSQQA